MNVIQAHHYIYITRINTFIIASDLSLGKSTYTINNHVGSIVRSITMINDYELILIVLIHFYIIIPKSRIIMTNEVCN